MKMCPFCDFENEDSASKCEACGTQLTDEAVSVATEVEENESGLYTVLMPGNSYKWIIKMLKKRFKLKGKVAKAKCMLGKIDGLSKADADALVAEIRNPVFPARAVPESKVGAYKAKISENSSWSVKIICGEDKSEVISYFAQEFRLDNADAKDYLTLCVREGDGTIYMSDIHDEAVAFADKLQSLGAETAVVESEPID